jgi:putative transposase
MRRAFVFRLYPTAEQDRALAVMLETHRRLYNAGLAERRDAWATERRGVTYGQPSAALKATRLTNPYLAATNFSSCQATLRRLNRAVEAFFRRVKAGEAAVGYPCFRGRGRFDTVDFGAGRGAGDADQVGETPGLRALQVRPAQEARAAGKLIGARGRGSMANGPARRHTMWD